MKPFIVKYTEVQEKEALVHADNSEDAKERFENGD